MSATTEPVWINLTAEALEDLHTCSGTGGGDIDALVQRDRRGQPVIRASHLRGLLRDAAEELKALDALAASELRALFGDDKGKGRLRMGSLRTEGAQLIAWSSTARVPGKRNPARDTLRHIEYVAAGTTFTGRLRLPDATHRDLILRLLKRIDRIGGDRSRGSGLVKLMPSEQPFPLRPEPTIGVRLQLILRNIEPLCLPATGQPGNLIRTQSFIRGQALRGALIAWAIETGRSELLDLFSRVSVGDALPLPEGVTSADGVMPIPLSILTEKPGAGDPELPWWSGAQPPSAWDGLGDREQASAEKPKRPGANEYLCRLDGGQQWLRYAPPIAVRLRNATPHRDSRDEAQLFSLEEIAEDTHFQAELVFADADAAAGFVAGFGPLLRGGDWVALGRGGLPVEVASVFPAQAMSIPASDDGWSLTLASDLIVRGNHLGFLEDLDIDVLCACAGIEADPGWKIHDKRYVETETVRGFNAVTGLQRAPALAIRRGSCWMISGAGSARLAARLVGLPALGERTDEGFGRLVVGLQPIGALDKPPGIARDPAPNDAEAMLRAAKAVADEIPKPGPSRSQLQWLRQRSLAAQSEGQLEKLFTEIEEAPTCRERSGGPWEHFPGDPLKTELNKLPGIEQKRLFVAQVVAWRTGNGEESDADE